MESTADLHGLHADGPWFDLDTSLFLLSGIIMLSCAGIFLSAKRFDVPSNNDGGYYTVGAAGVTVNPLARTDIVGQWHGDELTFVFGDDGRVVVTDTPHNEELFGTWEWHEAERSVEVLLTEASLPVKLDWSVDGALLILSAQDNSDFALGTVLAKD